VYVQDLVALEKFVRKVQEYAATAEMGIKLKIISLP
jgi:hypothetical protein